MKSLDGLRMSFTFSRSNPLRIWFGMSRDTFCRLIIISLKGAQYPTYATKWRWRKATFFFLFCSLSVTKQWLHLSRCAQEQSRIVCKHIKVATETKKKVLRIFGLLQNNASNMRKGEEEKNAATSQIKCEIKEKFFYFVFVVVIYIVVVVVNTLRAKCLFSLSFHRAFFICTFANIFNGVDC